MILIGSDVAKLCDANSIYPSLIDSIFIQIEHYIAKVSRI